MSEVRKAGAASAAGEKQQHVDLYRKLNMRKMLLRTLGPVTGAAYVPFIGDGDIAAELYNGRFTIFGADLDPARVEAAGARLQYSKVIVGDCDGWPFQGITRPFVVGDFDAYSEPYTGFRAFFAESTLADRIALFFTDGHRWGVTRAGVWHRPDGVVQRIDENKPGKVKVNERRAIFNGYLTKHIYPWFAAHVERSGFRVVQKMGYLRAGMTYWGAVVERS